jgi:hypothetical protein
MASVVYPPAVLAKLGAWGELAWRRGLRESFAAAVREMDDRLGRDPEAWGDPLWDYRGLRLTFYQRYGPVLVVRYAVHIDGTPVFVRQVLLTPGSPLAEASG